MIASTDKEVTSRNRHIIEIITVLVALIVTFYAGYSLGHDHGTDDKVKTNAQHTITTTSFANTQYPTTTPSSLPNTAPPSIATPN